MIQYTPCEKTRNEQYIQRMEERVMQQSPAARRVHNCALDLVDALHCLEGINWNAHLDFDAGFLSFSRDWS